MPLGRCAYHLPGTGLISTLANQMVSTRSRSTAGTAVRAARPLSSSAYTLAGMDTVLPERHLPFGWHGYNAERVPAQTPAQDHPPSTMSMPATWCSTPRSRAPVASQMVQEPARPCQPNGKCAAQEHPLSAAPAPNK